MLSGNLIKFSAHAPQNIAPQIMSIIFWCDKSTGIPQYEIGTCRASVPDSLLDFTFQLSRNPRSMALDEEGLARIKTIYPHFVHEFFGPSNEDSRRQLFASVDLTESVQDGKLFRQDRTAVGDGRLGKGQFERKIQIGLLFGRNLVQVSREGTIDDDTSRSRLVMVIDNQDDSLMKDTTQLFVRHQNTSLFDMRNRMRPSVSANVGDALGFHVNRQFGRTDKGILIQEIFRLRNSNRVAAQQGCDRGLLVVSISAENTGNGGAKQVAKLSLLVQRSILLGVLWLVVLASRLLLFGLIVSGGTAAVAALLIFEVLSELFLLFLGYQLGTE
mmetsp:Transcript_19149/g.54605  ORF Transcript_19149/g.54605 Transcript_19149/m.54605 type:complete len:329 (+) Transcript_19149:321-1307(+)